MTASMRKQSAERQKEEQRQKQDVPAADNEDDSGEHDSPHGKAHAFYRSSVYGSGLPAFARPRLIM
jgi:hypothetical protein